MIDLTPLDVRKKREDFRKTLRGYDPEEVDTFLALAAERMEELVKENLTLRERSDRLEEQLSSQLGRERAVQEALVSAQELRDDIREQTREEADDVVARAKREAELVRKEAVAEAERVVEGARRELEDRRAALKELERKRIRFLRTFRSLLERELDAVDVEEGRTPLDETPVEWDDPTPSDTPGPATEPSAEPLDEAPLEWEDPTPSEGPASAKHTPGSAPDATPAEDAGDDDPRRWLSSLVERELNEKPDDDAW